MHKKTNQNNKKTITYEQKNDYIDTIYTLLPQKLTTAYPLQKRAKSNIPFCKQGLQIES